MLQTFFPKPGWDPLQRLGCTKLSSLAFAEKMTAGLRSVVVCMFVLAVFHNSFSLPGGRLVYIYSALCLPVRRPGDALVFCVSSFAHEHEGACTYHSHCFSSRDQDRDLRKVFCTRLCSDFVGRWGAMLEILRPHVLITSSLLGTLGWQRTCDCNWHRPEERRGYILLGWTLLSRGLLQLSCELLTATVSCSS